MQALSLGATQWQSVRGLWQPQHMTLDEEKRRESPKEEMMGIIPSIVASTHGDQMTFIAKISLDSFKLNTHAR